MEKISIQTMVKKHLEKAGFGDEVHTHSLRASFCTNVYSSGKVGIKTVQDLMGHSAMSTTARYLGVTDEDKRNAVSDIY
jgi:site-specific recombinase XerD